MTRNVNLATKLGMGGEGEMFSYDIYMDGGSLMDVVRRQLGLDDEEERYLFLFGGREPIFIDASDTLAAARAEDGMELRLLSVEEAPPFFISPTLADMVLNIADYEDSEGRLIGRGGCAEVTCAIHKKTGKKVALKRMKVFPHDSKKLQVREMAVHALCDHPTIVKMLGILRKNEDMLLVTEFEKQGDIQANYEKLTVLDQFCATFGIAYGMMYLHGKNIVHRDLKPLNVLLDRDKRVKICDFGLSKHMQSEADLNNSLYDGSPEYMAPELTEGEVAMLAVDVYAYGMTLYALWHKKKRLFPERMTAYKIIQEVCKEQRPDIRDDLADGLKELIESCWAHQPHDRPSFEQIVEALSNREMMERMGLKGAELDAYMEYVDMCKSYRNADVRDGTDSVEKISDEYKVDKQYIKFWHNNREVPANEPIPPEAKPVLRVPVLLPNESIEYVHAPLDATVNDVITMLCDLHDLDRSVSEGMLLYCNKRRLDPETMVVRTAFPLALATARKFTFKLITVNVEAAPVRTVEMTERFTESDTVKDMRELLATKHGIPLESIQVWRRMNGSDWIVRDSQQILRLDDGSVEVRVAKYVPTRDITLCFQDPVNETVAWTTGKRTAYETLKEDIRVKFHLRRHDDIYFRVNGNTPTGHEIPESVTAIDVCFTELQTMQIITDSNPGAPLARRMPYFSVQGVLKCMAKEMNVSPNVLYLFDEDVLLRRHEHVSGPNVRIVIDQKRFKMEVDGTFVDHQCPMDNTVLQLRQTICEMRECDLKLVHIEDWNGTPFMNSTCVALLPTNIKAVLRERMIVVKTEEGPRAWEFEASESVEQFLSGHGGECLVQRGQILPNVTLLRDIDDTCDVVMFRKQSSTGTVSLQIGDTKELVALDKSSTVSQLRAYVCCKYPELSNRLVIKANFMDTRDDDQLQPVFSYFVTIRDCSDKEIHCVIKCKGKQVAELWPHPFDSIGRVLENVELARHQVPPKFVCSYQGQILSEEKLMADYALSGEVILQMHPIDPNVDVSSLSFYAIDYAVNDPFYLLLDPAATVEDVIEMMTALVVMTRPLASDSDKHLYYGDDECSGRMCEIKQTPSTRFRFVAQQTLNIVKSNHELVQCSALSTSKIRDVLDSERIDFENCTLTTDKIMISPDTDVASVMGRIVISPSITTPSITTPSITTPSLATTMTRTYWCKSVSVITTEQAIPQIEKIDNEPLLIPSETQTKITLESHKRSKSVTWLVEKDEQIGSLAERVRAEFGIPNDGSEVDLMSEGCSLDKEDRVGDVTQDDPNPKFEVGERASKR